MKYLAAAVCVLALLGNACSNAKGGYNDRHGLRDAPIGNKVHGAWDVIEAPDKVGNVFTRCDDFQPGKRIYMVTHGTTDVQPVIVDDPACGK